MIDGEQASSPANEKLEVGGEALNLEGVSDVSLSDEPLVIDHDNTRNSESLTLDGANTETKDEESVSEKARHIAISVVKITTDAVGKAAEVASHTISKLHEEKTPAEARSSTDSPIVDEKPSIWAKVRKFSIKQGDNNSEAAPPVEHESGKEKESIWGIVRKLSSKPSHPTPTDDENVSPHDAEKIDKPEADVLNPNGEIVSDQTTPTDDGTPGLWAKVKIYSGTAAISIAESATSLAATASQAIQRKPMPQSSEDRTKGTASETEDSSEKEKNENSDNSVSEKTMTANEQITESALHEDGASKGEEESYWKSVRKLSISAADTFSIQAAAAWHVTKETTAKAVDKVKAMANESEHKKENDALDVEGKGRNVSAGGEEGETGDKNATLEDAAQKEEQNTTGEDPEARGGDRDSVVSDLWNKTKTKTTSAVSKLREVLIAATASAEAPAPPQDTNASTSASTPTSTSGGAEAEGKGGEEDPRSDNVSNKADFAGSQVGEGSQAGDVDSKVQVDSTIPKEVDGVNDVPTESDVSPVTKLSPTNVQLLLSSIEVQGDDDVDLMMAAGGHKTVESPEKSKEDEKTELVEKLEVSEEASDAAISPTPEKETKKPKSKKNTPSKK